jgi:eukaryotic-like serine/threonine-protein kinase
VLRPRQRFGKYRIVRRLAQGGFAVVYEALDTIEGVRVALKVPHTHLLKSEALADFKREVRMTARLDHPNILPIKNADFIEDHFVIASALGEKSLGERMKSRMASRTVLRFAEQMIEAIAHAHRRHIVHCDIKPDNFILFPRGKVRLTDFGIAKISFRTLSASGAGTLGYVAPEQALGRPSMSSDVFSLGLVLFQMLARELPRWPFEWPPPGAAALRRKFPIEGIDLIRRALEVDTRRRFHDANQMRTAFQRLKQTLMASPRRRKRWL